MTPPPPGDDVSLISPGGLAGVWRVVPRCVAPRLPCLDIVSSRDHDKCQIVKLQPEPVIKVQRVRFTEQLPRIDLLKYHCQRMDIERY